MVTKVEERIIKSGILVAACVVLIGVIGVYLNAPQPVPSPPPDPRQRDSLSQLPSSSPSRRITPRAKPEPLPKPKPSPEAVRSQVLKAVVKDIEDASRRSGEYPFDAFKIDETGTVLYVRVTDEWFAFPKHIRRELAWSLRLLCMKHLKRITGEDHSVLVILSDRTGHVVARSAGFGTDVYE